MFLVTPNFWKTVWCPEMIPQNLGYFFWTPNSDYAPFFLDALCTYYTSFDRIPREEFIFSFCLHLRDACVCFSRLFNEVFFLADLSGKSRKEKSFFFFYFRDFFGMSIPGTRLSTRHTSSFPGHALPGQTKWKSSLSQALKSIPLRFLWEGVVSE